MSDCPGEAGRPSGNGQLEGHGARNASVPAGKGTWPVDAIRTDLRIVGIARGYALA